MDLKLVILLLVAGAVTVHVLGMSVNEGKNELIFFFYKKIVQSVIVFFFSDPARFERHKLLIPSFNSKPIFP